MKIRVLIPKEYLSNGAALGVEFTSATDVLLPGAGKLVVVSDFQRGLHPVLENPPILGRRPAFEFAAGNVCRAQASVLLLSGGLNPAPQSQVSKMAQV